MAGFRSGEEAVRWPPYSVPLCWQGWLRRAVLQWCERRPAEVPLAISTRPPAVAWMVVGQLELGIALFERRQDKNESCVSDMSSAQLSCSCSLNFTEAFSKLHFRASPTEAPFCNRLV